VFNAFGVNNRRSHAENPNDCHSSLPSLSYAAAQRSSLASSAPSAPTASAAAYFDYTHQPDDVNK
ncbi:MAG: hypothetical protein KDA60_18755, partial [Planctomycetales bacterium]|nr:hypothetical protein [Planctomycetales bacterium]